MYGVATITFAVYEDATEFVGVASATQPDISSKTATINGAGIAGDVEVPLSAQIEAMSMELTFHSYEKNIAKLMEPRRHKLELREVVQYEDPVRGELLSGSQKHVYVAVPKSATGGSVAPATSGEVKIAFAVRSWTRYIDGKIDTEIDQLNGIYRINGIDYGASIRKALGK